MKTICAWCGSTISVNCEHCGEKLIPAITIGGTFALYGDALICLTSETPMVYSKDAVQRMAITHGLCETCSRLPSTERDALLTQRRLTDPRLPSAADLDAIAAEQRISEATKDAAPHLEYFHEKRGPTDVPRRATPRVPDRKDKP